MKITILLSFTCVFSLFAKSSFSQDAKLSMSYKNITLSQLFNKIESESNYVFLLSDDVSTSLDKNVDVEVEGEGVDAVLKSALSESDISYLVVGRQIAIYKDEKTAPLVQQAKKMEQEDNIVNGRVSDSRNEPLIGVSISIVGTGKGTVTDVDGNYSLRVEPNEKLRFSYLGFKTSTVGIEGRKVINVTLQESAADLEEVVVVGYGVQKRKHLTGAVSQVSSDELLKAPMTNINNMIAGKLPGVTAQQSSGIPGGDRAALTVRGYSTMTNASPLFIVDGIERAIHTVNPQDVESVTALKDAAAAAVYGVRAANGVILITTKRGSLGRPELSYSGSATFAVNTRFPKLLDGPGYAYWHNKARTLDGNEPLYDADAVSRIKNGDPNGIYGNTNWFDELYENYGLTHQHNVSISGGADKVKYYTSVGYLDQDGIIKGKVDYKRFNIRSNFDVEIIEGLNLSLNLSGFTEDTNWPGISLASQSYMNPISQSIYAAPIIPMKHNGQYVAWQGESGDEVHNPVASIYQSGFTKTEGKKFEGNANLSYEMPFLEGLKASLFFSYDDSYTENKNMLQTYDMLVYNWKDKKYEEKPASASGNGSVNKSASSGHNYTIRPSLQYEQTFGEKHTIGALFLYERFKSSGSTMTAYRNHPIFNYPVDIGWATEVGRDATGSFSHNARIGYVGRLNYAYENKYLAEVAFRVDGSPVFRGQKRWGFFPSASAGWVISEEDFFRESSASSTIDYLKVRSSYGMLGQDDADPYLYRTTFSMTSPNYAYGFGSGGSTKPLYGLYTNNVNPAFLTWSKSKTFDAGVELTAWNGLLRFEFDWFYTITSDILIGAGAIYPPSLGGNYQSHDNTGKLDNRGFELILGHANKIGEVSYDLTGSLAWARNKVLSEPQGANVPWYRNRIGRPQGEMYGLKAIGLYQTQEQLDNRPIGPLGTNSFQRLGDIMYEDINGDGIIDSNDYVKIGRSSLPELSFSFNMNFSYKNFDVSALWQGEAIKDIRLQGTYYSGTADNTMYTRPFYLNGNAPYYLVEGAWTPENTDAKYPRLSTEWNSNNGHPSSWWVVNGGYLRLKNAQLGYTVPKEFLAKFAGGISNVRLYVAGTNLLTFNAFKYIDPEMTGINNGYYPQQKTYSVGLNVTF